MADYSYTTEAQAYITEVPLFWGLTAWDVSGIVEIQVIHEDQVLYYSDGSGYPGYDGVEMIGALAVEEAIITHDWLPNWAVAILERVFARRIEEWLLEALEQVDTDEIETGGGY
jgi:hypothetical protein